MTAHAVVLVNPTARRAAPAAIDALVTTLRARWSVDAIAPPDAAATTAAAAHAAASGAAVVVAAGGDGTAADVARGLLGTSVPLALHPLGTANDLARALGLPHNPAAAARRLLTAAPRPIDLVAVNDTAFCTVGGLGIVTDSALLAGRLKTSAGAARRLARATGGAIYRLTAPYALLRRAPLAVPLIIEWTSPDGHAHELRLQSPGLFVANTRHCGGGLRLPGVGPDDDGAFELLVIQNVGRTRLLEAFTRLTLGLPIPDRILQVIPARAARIVATGDETLLADGDSLRVDREFVLRSLSNAVRVIA